MTEIQLQKITHAFDELKKAREELRVKMATLGKDAGDVLKDAEDLVKFIEAKLTGIGEATVKDAQTAVAFVKEKLQKVRREAEKIMARREPVKKVEPPAVAKA